jgi:uncharacterized SAM-binding protein YcdF (DUF218 family)
MRNKRNGYAAYRGGRRHSVLYRILLVVVLLAVIAFGALQGVIFAGSRTNVSKEPDVVLILGCQVKEEGPSILLKDRLDTALQYLETAEKDLPIVVSGGQGPDEPVSEAQAMKDYLVEQGIEAERIQEEDRSHNTSENLIYSRELLESLGYDMETTEVLLISNGFHLARATMLADRYGIQTERLAAPATHLPTKAAMFFREPLALVKSFLFD